MGVQTKICVMPPPDELTTENTERTEEEFTARQLFVPIWQTPVHGFLKCDQLFF